MGNFRTELKQLLAVNLQETGYNLNPVFEDEPSNYPDVHYRLVADTYAGTSSERGSIEHREIEFFVNIRFKTERDIDKSGDITVKQDEIIELYDPKFFQLLNYTYENDNAKHKIIGVEFDTFPTIDSAQGHGSVIFDGKFIYTKEWKW